METTAVYKTTAEVLFLRQSEELVPGQAFFKAINTEDFVSYFKINQTIYQVTPENITVQSP